MLQFIIPALLPAIADGIRGVFARITGSAGGNPQNVNERIALMQAETDRLKALAEIDKPIGNPSQWVVDIRAIFRYAFVSLIWLATAIAVFSGIEISIVLMMLDLSGACTSFIIGERMYFNIKNR